MSGSGRLPCACADPSAARVACGSRARRMTRALAAPGARSPAAKRRRRKVATAPTHAHHAHHTHHTAHEHTQTQPPASTQFCHRSTTMPQRTTKEQSQDLLGYWRAPGARCWNGRCPPCRHARACCACSARPSARAASRTRSASTAARRHAAQIIQYTSDVDRQRARRRQRSWRGVAPSALARAAAVPPRCTSTPTAGTQ